MPWTQEYRKLLFSLWRKRLVVIAAPDEIKLKGASRVLYAFSSPTNAFDSVDQLERKLAGAWIGGANLVILSCGPTATVLADRLARKGIWAVDLGNFGKFL